MTRGRRSGGWGGEDGSLPEAARLRPWRSRRGGRGAPADKRPCTAEPSTSAAVAPEGEAAAAERACSDMDTSSSGHAGDGEADGDGDGGEGMVTMMGMGMGMGTGVVVRVGWGREPEEVRRGREVPADGGGGGGGRRGGGGGGGGADGALRGALLLRGGRRGILPDGRRGAGAGAAGRGGADGAAAAASPDVMLLSVRAITYLCDAMPRAADAVVRHGLLPLLCSRLLAIEYLDVAEQVTERL